MCRPRVVIEEFDPPVALPADLPDRTQDDPIEHPSRVSRLDRADQAITAVDVAQSSLAPLRLGGEQTLDRTQLGERTIVKQICAVERHFLTPRSARCTRSPAPKTTAASVRIGCGVGELFSNG